MRIFNHVLFLLTVAVAVPRVAATTSKYRIAWHGDPTTTLSVDWVQESGADAVVYYGPEDKGTAFASYPSRKPADRAASQAGLNHRFARLTGLLPNTAYYFVIKDDAGMSPRM